jgi:hypothetical protein
MMNVSRNILQRSERAAIMRRRSAAALLALVWLAAQPALAQDKPAPKGDDLEVTMQIITDPDAKRSDEVVRHIPLPPRKPPAAADKKDKDVANEGQERARDAKELAREAAERAKEQAQEAAEQREQAARSRADEQRRNPDPPRPPPRPRP